MISDTASIVPIPRLHCQNQASALVINTFKEPCGNPKYWLFCVILTWQKGSTGEGHWIFLFNLIDIHTTGECSFVYTEFFLCGPGDRTQCLVYARQHFNPSLFLWNSLSKWLKFLYARMGERPSFYSFTEVCNKRSLVAMWQNGVQLSFPVLLCAPVCDVIQSLLLSFCHNRSWELFISTVITVKEVKT